MHRFIALFCCSTVTEFSLGLRWKQVPVEAQPWTCEASLRSQFDNELARQVQKIGVKARNAQRRVAVIFRGESFRGGNLSDVKNADKWSGKQFGPFKRVTCGSKSFQRQQATSSSHMRFVHQLEAQGYIVDIFGVTYPCDEATKTDFTVEDSLPMLYEGRLQLQLLERKHSQQITGHRSGFRMVTDNMSKKRLLYDYVVSTRWDADSINLNQWGCHLKKGLTWPEDLMTLEGIGNDDNLQVVPGRHVLCYGDFLARDWHPHQSPDTLTCCSGSCGGGDCHQCRRHFIKGMSGMSVGREVLPKCPEVNLLKSNEDPLGAEPIYSDIPDWLPDSDKDCMEENAKGH